MEDKAFIQVLRSHYKEKDSASVFHVMCNAVQSPSEWAYGVVVSMFDFHRSDRGSNPGRGGKIS